MNLHFVPLDFTKENLATALKRSSYDPKVLTFFSWLGVTYYLSRDLVFDTLRTIADIAPQGSTIVFDYFDTDVFVLRKWRPGCRAGSNLPNGSVNPSSPVLILPRWRCS